jgi:hypothetical protein
MLSSRSLFSLAVFLVAGLSGCGGPGKKPEGKQPDTRAVLVPIAPYLG